MAQDHDNDAQPAAEAPEPEFTIRKIYLKDGSFESPGAPAIFAEDWRPEVDLQVQTGAQQLGPGDYEVTLTVTATVNVADKVAFLVEVEKAGIFSISGIAEEQMAAMLGAYCPGILFPYAREVVSDLSVRGGFPQLVLSPVNFDALYARRQQEAAAEA